MGAVLNKRGVAAPVLLAVIAGLLIGVGVYTFGYARGASYMTDNPAACANCHVMQDQYQSWMKGSHGKVAVCNDCHTPPGFVSKYATKAINGFFHSLAFTTQHFPDEIHITDRNFRVTEKVLFEVPRRYRCRYPRNAGPSSGRFVYQLSQNGGTPLRSHVMANLVEHDWR